MDKHLCERAIILHLGAECSATALLRGKSVDTTMGYTPLEGLVMASRAGDIDPGILFHAQRELGLDVAQLEKILNQDSGLLALSGLSADMRVLLAHQHFPSVALTLEVFCYRAAKAEGALTVALGGLDQLIFSGGIGEHLPTIRYKICARLSWLGAMLDETANLANAKYIAADGNSLQVYVIPVDEGRVIARETANLNENNYKASDA